MGVGDEKELREIIVLGEEYNGVISAYWGTSDYGLRQKGL